MAETTWKQAVYDIADAYREAEGTTGKISIANLKEKVRDGGGKVYLDGERIKQLEMTSYKGDNPFTMGQEGMSFDANTLITEDFTIINGVSGEDLTETASRQTTSTDILLREVKRKIADHKGEGEYVWKKYEYVPAQYTETPLETVTLSTSSSQAHVSYDTEFTISDGKFVMPNYIVRQFNSADNGSDLLQGKYFRGSATTSTTLYKATDSSIYSYVDPKQHYVSNVIEMTEPRDSIIGNFLDYIVSSDPEAYPDGGEQDGFWYERVSEGLTPKMFGCTKMAVDTFTFSSDTPLSDLRINHSLGVKPSVAIVYAENQDFTETSVYYLHYDFVMLFQNVQAKLARFYKGTSPSTTNNNLGMILNTNNTNDSVIWSGNGSSYMYQAGIEYTLITMA